MKTPCSRLLTFGVLLLLAGCGGIPAGALRLGPDSAANREMQTRAFRTSRESDVLAASAAVLQDLGFTLDESETKLGVLVASKERSAVNAFEVTLATLEKIRTLGLGDSRYQKRQVIRASLVVRPAPPGAVREHAVRVTFQRRVYDNYGGVVIAQPLNDPSLYQEFYARLGQSVALEALSP